MSRLFIRSTLYGASCGCGAFYLDAVSPTKIVLKSHFFFVQRFLLCACLRVRGWMIFFFFFLDIGGQDRCSSAAPSPRGQDRQPLRPGVASSARGGDCSKRQGVEWFYLRTDTKYQVQFFGPVLSENRYFPLTACSCRCCCCCVFYY